jgi:hypothetical protein
MFDKYPSIVRQFVERARTPFLSAVLLTLLSSLSLAAGQNDAYQHLYEVMDRCHTAFYVYANQDDGCNHFYPSGWMGDLSAISFDSNWTSDVYSGDSCTKITFSARGDNWAGIYWLEPENNWGTTPDGGYDLTGATKITFWARGEKGGERIEFFAGGVRGPYPDSFPKTSTGFITLTKTWKQYAIDLSLRDLSHVIGGFGWATNDTYNPSGATYYLDDIAYDKARPNELRFLNSYVPLPFMDPDRYIKNAGFLYDNALALLAFLARGNPDDLRRARILADSFINAMDHDRHYTDGRLRNAYMSGDLIDHQTGKARIPGWWDPADEQWYEDQFQVSTYTGNLAWTMIALLNYYKKMGGDHYLAASIKLGEWIENDTRDARCSGGYTGGYDGWEPNPKKILWKSTEHNIDIYVAFKLLCEVTGEATWEERALYARRFVEAMWNDADGHFWTGTLEDGCTINRSNIPLDIQAWAVMALDSYTSALTWAESNCYTEKDGFAGFDFNDDKDGVWFEGTGQMAVAYQLNGEKAKADFLSSELIKAQASATNADRKGIVAASHDGVTTGFDWEYFSRLHVGATAWYLFGERGFNPYWATATVPVPVPNIKANGSDGPLSISQSDLLTISISLDPGSYYDGSLADWWVAASTPFGLYWFTLGNGWVRSDAPVRVHAGALFNLPSYSVLEISGLPIGDYTFYFAVDDNMDGMLNATFLNAVSVRIQ